MDSKNDVRVFMDACDQKARDFGGQAELYMDLVMEEFRELIIAYGNRDPVEIADACADLKWVIEGLEITLKLHIAMGSRKNFTGVLQGLLSGEPQSRDAVWGLLIEPKPGESAMLEFSLTDVDKARLVPVLDFKGKKS